MDVLDGILLGVIQGLTEFLPVSSSGHLVLVQQALGIRVEGVFLEATVHLATLLAVCIGYRSRIAGLAAGVFSAGDPGRESRRYAALLALASLPAAAVGLLFKDAIEKAFESPLLVSIMLAVTGAFLLTTRFAPASPARPIGAVSAAVVGCFQAAAILPGISRSGSTIGAGLWAGQDGGSAAEFSFLLSIPAVAGAFLLTVLDLAGERPGFVPLAAAFLAALAAGLAALSLINRVALKRRLHWFGPYCLAAGVLGIILSCR